MSISEIVRAWKADQQNEYAPKNPAGQELTEAELAEVVGGGNCGGGTCVRTCEVTCEPLVTCNQTCTYTE